MGQKGKQGPSGHPTAKQAAPHPGQGRLAVWRAAVGAQVVGPRGRRLSHHTSRLFCFDPHPKRLTKWVGSGPGPPTSGISRPPAPRGRPPALPRSGAGGRRARQPRRGPPRTPTGRGSGPARRGRRGTRTGQPAAERTAPPAGPGGGGASGGIPKTQSPQKY